MIHICGDVCARPRVRICVSACVRAYIGGTPFTSECEISADVHGAVRRRAAREVCVRHICRINDDLHWIPRCERACVRECVRRDFTHTRTHARRQKFALPMPMLRPKYINMYRHYLLDLCDLGYIDKQPTLTYQYYFILLSLFLL